MRFSRWIAGFFALVLCSFIAAWGCPSLRLLQLPCPGCGVTRAWLAFLCGDLRQALAHNLFFLPLTGLFVWAIINTVFERKPICLEKIVAYSIAGTACVYNFFRMLQWL